MSNFLQDSQAFNNLSAMHDAGLNFGSTIALYGAGFSIGKHIIRLTRGKVTFGVAVANVIRDTLIFFGISYFGGALASGAIKLAASATNANIPTDLNAVTSGVTDTAVGESATALSGAASDLIRRVTDGLFGMMGSAGSSVGGKLTEATAGTEMGGTVAAFVDTFGKIGSFIGGATSSAVPAILFGAVIGIIFAVIKE